MLLHPSNLAGNAMVIAPAGGQTLWIALADLPEIEEAVAPSGGGQPTLTDFVPGIPQQSGHETNFTYIALGPDNNLWAATGTSYTGTVEKFAY